MSSTSNTTRSRTAAASRTTNAPRRLRRRPCGLSRRLALRRLLPLQYAARHRPAMLPVLRRSVAVNSGGDAFGMVEATLAALGAIERHRNDKHMGAWVDRQLGHGGRQPPPEMPGNGGHAVVFQQVDEAAQLVFVSAVGDRPGRTQRVSPGIRRRAAAVLTQDGTARTAAAPDLPRNACTARPFAALQPTSRTHR